MPRGLVLVLLMTASTCGASPGGRPDDALERPIAANQSVALEGASTAATPIAEPLGSGRLVRPRRSSADLTRTSRPPGVGVRALPWYRTGLGALAIVLAFVGVAYGLARRWMPSARSSGDGVLCVVGRTALTPKHSATLVQMGRRYVLVGVSPNRIERLCDICDPDEVAALTALLGVRGARRTRGFDRLLIREAVEHEVLEEEALQQPPVEPVGVRAARSARPPGSLTDLLQRLRVLSAAGKTE